MPSLLLRKTFRDFKRIKMRVLASMLLISLGCTTFCAMSAMMPSVWSSLHIVYDRLHLSDYVVMVDAAPTNVTDDLLGLSSVRYAYGRFHLSGLVTIQGENITGDLMGFNSSSMPSVNNISITVGSYLDPDEPFEVLLDQRFAQEHGQLIGENLTITILGQQYNFTIRGYFLSPEYVLAAVNPMAVYPTPGSLAAIIIPLKTMQSISGLHGYVNEFCVLFEDGVDQEAAREEVDDLLEDYGIRKTIKREDMFGYSFVETDLTFGVQFIGLLSSIVIGVAFFVSFSAMHRLVYTQRREIGVLRGLGYSQRSILVRYVIAAVIFGLLSSIIGILLALPLTPPISHEYMKVVSGFPLQVMVFPPDSLLIAVAIGPIATAMAMTAAAWNATHTPPHHAIRGEMVDMRPVKQTLVERALGRLSAGLLSYPSRYLLRQISRRRVRSLLVVLAISFSMAIAATGPVIMSSTAYSFEYALTVHDSWDYAVSFSRLLAQTEVDNLNLTHAETVVPLLRFGGYALRTGSGASNKSVGVIALPWNNTLHISDIKEGHGLEERGSIIMVPRLARKLAVAVGDHVTLYAGDNSTQLKVTGITRDIISEAIIRLDDARSLLGITAASGILVKAKPGHTDQLRDQLYHKPQVALIQSREEVVTGMRRMLDYFSEIIQIFTVLGLLMTILIVGNLVLIGSLERKSEYTLMRTLGYGRGSIAKIVIGETTILTLLGVLAGIPLTWALNQWMGTQPLMEDIFPAYRVFIDWPQIAITGTIILATALIATLPSINMLLRLPLHQVIRERHMG